MSTEIRKLKSWLDKQRIARFLEEKYDNIYILFDIENYYLFSLNNQFYYTLNDGEIDSVVLVYYSSSGMKDIWGYGDSDSLSTIFDSLDLNKSVIHVPTETNINKLKGYSSIYKEYCMFMKPPKGVDNKKVRLLSQEDYLGYMKLMVNWNGSRFPYMSPEDYINSINYGTIYGYVDGDSVLSAASVGAIWKQWFVISSVFTDPNFRNRGLAKTVISKLLYDYSHMDTAILFVNVDNSPAISAYEKLGFKIYSTNYWIDYGTGLIP